MSQRTVPMERWEDFEAAFYIGSPDARYFLNVESGEVVYTSHMDDEKVRGRILERTRLPGWLELPRASTPEGMDEVRAFVASETRPELLEALTRSLAERVPLRAFMRVVYADPQARARWATDRIRAIHRRILAFCEHEGLVIDHDRYRELTGSAR